MSARQRQEAESVPSVSQAEAGGRIDAECWPGRGRRHRKCLSQSEAGGRGSAKCKPGGVRRQRGNDNSSDVRDKTRITEELAR